jgi:hypothetical protein
MNKFSTFSIGLSVMAIAIIVAALVGFTSNEVESDRYFQLHDAILNDSTGYILARYEDYNGIQEMHQVVQAPYHCVIMKDGEWFIDFKLLNQHLESNTDTNVFVLTDGYSIPKSTSYFNEEND